MRKALSFRAIVSVALIVVLAGLMPARPAQAACCSCIGEVGEASQSEWFYPPWYHGSTHVINAHIDNEFNAHETWLLKFLLEDNILPAMMLMAEQLTVSAMAQVGVIGMMFDAKQQLETQRTLQNIQADIQRDYQPSVGLCEFGSGIKSLAATERLAEYNAVFLGQRSLDRHLGNAYTASAGGEQYDKENRFGHFKRKYCDPKDNNGNGLATLCTPGDLKNFNKDVDFSRTLGIPWTIEVNYGDLEVKSDEEDVFALQNNLFGHKVFNRIPPHFLMNRQFGVGGAIVDRNPEEVQDTFLDMRSVIAKRNVAENSFTQYAAMKAEGTGSSTTYLRAMMKELGVGDTPETEADLEKLLGKNPSYYAQMEMLTKKIYQNPDFYTNLYDTPANVSRKEAAMQALELIQKFDMFKSNLRAEVNLSLMLENAVVDLQKEVENTVTDISPDSDIRPVHDITNDLQGANPPP